MTLSKWGRGGGGRWGRQMSGGKLQGRVCWQGRSTQNAAWSTGIDDCSLYAMGTACKCCMMPKTKTAHHNTQLFLLFFTMQNR